MMNRIVLIVYLLTSQFCFAQYKNNRWLMGEGGTPPFPFGGAKIEFTNNTRTVSYHPRNIWLQSCFSGLSDDYDNWFVYSNGGVICNKDHDTLVNGSGLSPSSSGPLILAATTPSQALFVPGDTVNERHYLFHLNLEYSPPVHIWGPQPIALKLFYSIVDPLAANGKGAIISKNNIIVDDSLEIGNIMAVRHANGRDWWVVVKRFYKDLYYSILVTPDSVYAPIVVNTDPSPPHVMGGQAAFSPDGRYYASFSNGSQLRIFDFDRCNGSLSNFRYKFITNGIAGSISYSPNSRFLYITKLDSLWQFDMEATDVMASQTFIARYDWYIDTISNFQTIFGWHWLAPDGKIYMSTFNQSRYLHVINNPDLPGQACDFQQHSVLLPRLNNFTTPSYINLSLYHLPGSACDTLGVGLRPLQVADYKLQIFPNPSDGRFSVEYTPQRMSGMLYVYDVNGREVFREYVSPFTSVKNVDLSGKVHSGVYAVRLVWGNGSGVVGRVVVE
jgi:hypothetical protein